MENTGNVHEDSQAKVPKEIERLRQKVERMRGALLYVRSRDKDYQARAIIDAALED